MTQVKNISTQPFNYNLPDASIAHHPLEQRDASRLLVYRNGQISDLQFSQLPSLLQNNQTLVFNNTKVIQARILCQKQTGAAIEIFCLEPHQPADYAQMFASEQWVEWKCIVGNLKKWKGETLYKTAEIDGQTVRCSINLQGAEAGQQIIRFSWQESVCFAQLLQAIGAIPIPPYLNRAADESDAVRYQTVYAQLQGSVAAPTAGLHFTEQILTQLRNKGVGIGQLTLHVGAGTFRPMKSDTLGEHQMHTEHCIVQLDQLEQIAQSVPNIVAVGTTSVRTLESLYWIGVKLLSQPNMQFSLSQWELYETLPQTISAQEAFAALCKWVQNNKQDHLEFDTSLMIVPGYQFRTLCGIITNFHQPQSTLLLLVAAAMGDNWRLVYDHALATGYRFLSYGDSSLIWLK